MDNDGYMVYNRDIYIYGILNMGIYGIQWDRTKQQYELGG